MNDYSQYGGDPSNMMAMMGPYFAVIMIVGLAIAVFSIFCWLQRRAFAGVSRRHHSTDRAADLPDPVYLVRLRRLARDQTAGAATLAIPRARELASA